LQGAATGEFNAMSSQSHVSHSRVLLLGEFTVVIPEPHATLQGAATAKLNAMSSQSHVSHCRVLLLGEFAVMIPEPRHIAGCCHRQVQRHVIPEPRITLQGAATW